MPGLKIAHITTLKKLPMFTNFHLKLALFFGGGGRKNAGFRLKLSFRGWGKMQASRWSLRLFFSPPPVGREKCKGKNASLPLKPGHVGPNNFENDFANVELWHVLSSHDMMCLVTCHDMRCDTISQVQHRNSHVVRLGGEKSLSWGERGEGHLQCFAC